MSNELEVFKLHRQGQDKMTYFLLAAAGAAIGFALSQTREAGLGQHHAPLGLALLCWGGSFYAGCNQLRLTDSILYSNAEMLKIKRGAHPEVGSHPELIQAASEGVRQAVDKKAGRAQRSGHWQFRLILAGAIFYIGWHILEMYLRAFPEALKSIG